MKYSRIIPYAQDFVSFILEHISSECIEHVRNIILFGSAARAEHKKSSDVDIFIEVSQDPDSVEKEVEEWSEKFYDSVKYKNYWKLKGIQQVFSFKTGDQKDWKNLYPALLSDGIVLYGKYHSQEIRGSNRSLFFWDPIRSSTIRVNLHRTLYGYCARRKRYPGLLERYNGTKLSKGSILVPLEYRENFREFFKKLKVPVKELLVNVL